MKKSAFKKHRPTIALLINNLRDRYSIKLWPGVEDCANERDINLHIFTGETINSPYGFGYQHNLIYDLVNKRNIDAILMATGTLSNFINEKEFAEFYNKFSPIPIISIGLKLPNIPSVLVENKTGMRESILHLIQVHKYKKIAFIRGPKTNYEAEERFQAYKNVLTECKIPINDKLIKFGDFTPQSGLKAVNQLIDENKLNFDAIALANDDMALGALEALKTRKISVPGNIAIVGFDNLGETEFIKVPLTTVNQPLYELGRKATEIAVDLIDGKLVPETMILPTKLKIRSSCGCISQSIKMIESDVNNIELNIKTNKNNIEKQEEWLIGKILEFSRDSRNQPVEIEAWVMEALKLKNSNPGEEFSLNFLKTLSKFLSNDSTLGINVSYWQNIITLLSNHILFNIDDNSLIHDTDILFHMARVLIGEMLQLKHAVRGVQIGKHFYTAIEAVQALMSSRDVEKLMDTINQEIPSLGIESCYISLYPKEVPRKRNIKWKMPEKINLLLARNKSGRKTIQKKSKEYLTKDLLPEGLLPNNRRYTIIIKPLFVRQDQLGIIILEIGPKEGIIYETLRLQISSTLKSIYLFEGISMAENNALEANERLIDTNEKLKELNSLRTKFFTNVSHELRTPLTLILGPVESLLFGDYGKTIDTNNDIFHSIMYNASNLLKLINNLLDYSKIEAGKMLVNYTKTNISNLLQFYMLNIRSAAESKGLKIEYIDNTEGLIANIDRNLFQKAVFNLLSNALKFTAKGGSITLSLNSKKETFVIEVHDSGIGISHKDISVIFSRFGQAGDSESHNNQGTGIGLTLTKEIVELHGGTISVISQKGIGTTFTVKIPYNTTTGKENLSENFKKINSFEIISMLNQYDTYEENVSEQLSIETKEESSINQKKFPLIMVIDDNPEMRKFIGFILKKKYRIQYASDGKEGLKKAKKTLPDLILSDVMMPNMNGYQLCKIVKSDPILKHTPIILLTAKANILQKIEGLEYGSDDYITKPFNAKELIARINNLLHNKKNENELAMKQMIIDEDFQEASSVQKTILTSKDFYTKINKLDIDIRYLPMNKKVSGDYYNVSVLKKGIASFMISDVSGHGAQAAMTTMQIDILNKESFKNREPHERMDYINRKFADELISKNFFTSFILDIYKDRIIYSSAAHPSQYLIKKNSSRIIPLKTKGRIIGIFKDMEFTSAEKKIEKGDIIILFTDGIVESLNPLNVDFEDDILVKLLEDHMKKNKAAITMNQLNDFILNKIKSTELPESNIDDITIISIRIK
ncbi:MAG: substrate-binding domain-containing protein [Spirochaetes bacterium]|nr:substrate-binding domain-containing protein [Spirochaetota bacterium]